MRRWENAVKRACSKAERAFDVAIYEAGQQTSGPEAFMFRIHETATGEWSPWIYRKTSRFRSSRAEGAYATAVDFSDAGIRYGSAKS